MSLDVMIIGAGTGGLCLAHGLRQAGIKVSVFERDRTRRDGLQGYRVGISAGGSKALAQCLPPDLFDTFVATCARNPRYVNMMTEQLSELLSMEIPDEGDALKTEKSVSRMTLRQVLLTGLEEAVSFDKIFTHYETTSDGKVIAHFVDGTKAIGDVLVGAEGTGSPVRKQLLPGARLEETGIISIGGKLPLTAETRGLLTQKALNGISLIMAPGGFGAIIHVMEFKWDRDGVKEGIGGSDANLICGWPGFLYDNTSDYINWGIWGARQNILADPMKLRGQDLIDLAGKLARDWHPNFKRLIALTDPSTTFPINIRTSVPVHPWSTGPVTLLGDAIHTMTPGRGVGANTALRDAALLTQKLIEVRDRSKPLLAALHEYEAEMLDYSAEAVFKSREDMDANALIHKPVIGRIALAGMRMALRVVNLSSPLKRRMFASIQDLREG